VLSIIVGILTISGLHMSLRIREDSIFTLRVNSSSILGGFISLVSFVTIFILVYRKYYIRGDFNLNYYYFLMRGFSLRIIILLVADRLVVLILRWESLGIRSFFLINYYQT